MLLKIVACLVLVSYVSAQAFGDTYPCRATPQCDDGWTDETGSLTNCVAATPCWNQETGTALRCAALSQYSILNNDAREIVVERGSLFPPSIDVSQTKFVSGGYFRVVVAASTWYTAAANEVMVVVENTGSLDSTSQGSHHLEFTNNPDESGTAGTNYKVCESTYASGTYTNPTGCETQDTTDATVTANSDACFTNLSVKMTWAQLTADSDNDNTHLDGLDRANDGTTTTFRGSVKLTSRRDMKGRTFGTAYERVAIDYLLFEVTFPTTASITFNDLQVYAAVEIQVVLTTTAVVLTDLNVGATGPTVTLDVDFETTVQYPFEIETGSSDITAGTVTSTGGTVDDDKDYVTVSAVGLAPETGSDCTTTGASATPSCTQAWSLQTGNVDMNDAAASTPGYYFVNTDNCAVNIYVKVNVKLRCWASLPTECPITDDTEPADFRFNLKSSKLCPETAVAVGFTKAINAYRDESGSAGTTPVTAFLVDDFAWFVATFLVDDATAPDLTGCEISSVTSQFSPVTDPATGVWTVYAYDGTSITANSDAWVGDSNAQLSTDSRTCEAEFKLKLDDCDGSSSDTACFEVSRFSDKSFAITLTVSVTFQGFAKLLKSNGLLQDEDTGEEGVSAEIGIASAEVEVDETETGTGSVESDNGQTIVVEEESSGMFIYIIIGVCAFVALLIGALVMYLRRSKKEKKNNAITPQVQVQMQPRVGVVTQQQQQQPMAATA